MAKRVSLKGKGADIFFGEYAATSDEPTLASMPPSAGDSTSQPVSEEQTSSLAPVRRARTTSGQSTAQPTQAATDAATNQDSARSVKRPLNRPIDRVVDRPKAFYITEGLDSRIDEAVRYLQSRHGLRKVDRSILVTTLLSDDGLWTDTALDGLVDRLIDQLTSRLTR